MGDRKVLQKFQAFDTYAFEAVLGTDFFAQNQWIKYLSLQEPTHLLVVKEEQNGKQYPSRRQSIQDLRSRLSRVFRWHSIAR